MTRRRIGSCGKDNEVRGQRLGSKGNMKIRRMKGNRAWDTVAGQEADGEEMQERQRVNICHEEGHEAGSDGTSLKEMAVLGTVGNGTGGNGDGKAVLGSVGNGTGGNGDGEETRKDC